MWAASKWLVKVMGGGWRWVDECWWWMEMVDIDWVVGVSRREDVKWYTVKEDE